MRALLLALVAVSLSSVPSAAVAADAQTEEARQHFLKGQQFFELARWDEAIGEFEQAYAARNDPTFIYNMAQAHRRKGDARKALDLYKNYLIKAPKSMQRAEVEERIATLQKQLDDAGKAPGAAPAAVAPAPPPPMPEAAPAPPPMPAPVADPMPAPLPVYAPPPVAAATPPAYVQAPGAAPAAPVPGKGLRVAGIIVGATGVVALAAGVFFSLETDDYASTVEKNDVFNPNYDDRGKLYQNLQWVSYGAGAALLATGGILYGLGLSAGKQATVAVVPAASPGGAGLSAQGVF